jgi:hypothetical protein
MTNEKFSMTNSQFRLSALVAACRAGSLRLRAFALNSPCLIEWIRIKLNGVSLFKSNFASGKKVEKSTCRELVCMANLFA